MTPPDKKVRCPVCFWSWNKQVGTSRCSQSRDFPVHEFCLADSLSLSLSLSLFLTHTRTRTHRERLNRRSLEQRNSGNNSLLLKVSAEGGEWGRRGNSSHLLLKYSRVLTEKRRPLLCKVLSSRLPRQQPGLGRVSVGQHVIC